MASPVLQRTIERPRAPFAFDRTLPPEAGVRAQRRAEIQSAVGRAALELAEEHGFEAVTAEAIAHAAGVSRATFFRHFPRKESALFCWREAWLGEFERIVAERRSGESDFAAIERAFTAIGALYEAHRDHMVRHNAVVSASPGLQAHEAARDRDWEFAVVRAVSRDGVADDREAKWFGAALLGVLRATVRDWFEHDARTDLVAAGVEAMRWLVDRSDPTRPQEPE